jgi:Sigma-70 factor, region 1.1
MIPKKALDYLMQLGRQRGALEIDDIRQVLEVDTMTTEELADVVARLDEAGIPVEIDPALLAPRPPKMTPHEARPASESLRRSEQPSSGRHPLSKLESSVTAARGNLGRSVGQARKHVQGPPAIFVVVVALVLVLLALGVWRFV